MELSKDLSLRVGERGEEGRPAGLAVGAAAIRRVDGGLVERGSSWTWFRW